MRVLALLQIGHCKQPSVGGRDQLKAERRAPVGRVGFLTCDRKPYADGAKWILAADGIVGARSDERLHRLNDRLMRLLPEINCATYYINFECNVPRDAASF